MLISAQDAATKKVRAIEFSGLRNVGAGTVKSAIKISKGDVYDQKLVDEDISNIYKLGLFSDVSADVSDFNEGVKVTFTVQEKLIVKSIDFKGNKEFSNRKLRDEITTKVKEGYDTRDVHNDIGKISTLYKDKGYADVKVEDFSTTDDAAGFAMVTFSITEGSKVLIGEVTVEGVKKFKPKKILGLLDTKKKNVYKDQTFKDDLKKIEAFYKDRGYLNVKITDTPVTYNTERTKMNIRVIVDEGQQYVNGKVAFTGNTVFTKERLTDAFDMKEGIVFSQTDFEQGVNNLKALYADGGYIRAKFDPVMNKNEKTGIVDVSVDIKENGIIYIDKIFVDGNTKTKSYVVTRELLVHEGDVFAVGRIRRSQERLYNLGFFKDVKVDIEETKEPDKANLAIEVEEDKTGLISLGAGYSSVDKLVGTIQLTEINLYGRGQKLNLTYEFGSRKQNYELGFTEPYLFGNNLLFGVDVLNTTVYRNYQNDDTAYQERRRGGDVRIGKPLSEILNLDFVYAYEDVNVFDIASQFTGIILPERDVSSSLTSSITRDTRDNVFDTSRGSRHSLSLEVAGGPLGGSVNFVKPTVTASKFFPTIWKFVFGLNGKISYVRQFSPSKEVPIYERFYLGGADTVRGYDYGQIGPSTKGTIIFVSNAEYKFPLVQEGGRSIVSFAFFADMGGSWLKQDEISLKVGSKDTQMKTGAGFGLRLRPMPVLPIRIDWGYGFNHKPGEQRSQFYFTMGQVF